jgi:hypothetical protein
MRKNGAKPVSSSKTSIKIVIKNWAATSYCRLYRLAPVPVAKSKAHPPLRGRTTTDIRKCEVIIARVHVMELTGKVTVALV